MGKEPSSSCESWEELTCAGVPILCQLIALAAVALVGAVDVGTFLAAASSFALIHICGNRVFIIVSPPRLYTRLGWLTSTLLWKDFPFGHPLRKVGSARASFLAPRQSKAEPGATLLGTHTTTGALESLRYKIGHQKLILC